MFTSTTKPQAAQQWPRLIADIGGTNARFALETAPQKIEKIAVLACSDYRTLADAIHAYLYSVGNPDIGHAVIAIATPIMGDWVQMTNHHWNFSIEETRQTMGFSHLLVINDCVAQALAITQMRQDDLMQAGGNALIENIPKAVLGVGTGLGVSGLIPSKTGYVPLAGEGGHVSFAPFNDIEMLIWQYAQKKYGHVSTERLISGAGLSLIYEALTQIKSMPFKPLTPAEISEHALNDNSFLCKQALDIFCAMLGTAASNLALTLGARGGVYLCGGMILHIVDYFKTSPFRPRFDDKGRCNEYLATIPVYVVLNQYSGLYGAAVALANDLNELERGSVM